MEARPFWLQRFGTRMQSTFYDNGRSDNTILPITQKMLFWDWIRISQHGAQVLLFHSFCAIEGYEQAHTYSHLK